MLVQHNNLELLTQQLSALFVMQYCLFSDKNNKRGKQRKQQRRETTAAGVSFFFFPLSVHYDVILAF